MSNSKELIVRTNTEREKESLVKLLLAVEQLPDQKMETMFNLMPYEVQDVKDTLRKSNL